MKNNHLHTLLLFFCCSDQTLYVPDSNNIKGSKKKKKVFYLFQWQSPILFFYSLPTTSWIEESCMHACDELIELLFFFFLFINLFSILDRYYFMPHVRITKAHSIDVHTYCFMTPAVWQNYIYMLRMKGSIYNDIV